MKIYDQCSSIISCDILQDAQCRYRCNFFRSMNYYSGEHFINNTHMRDKIAVPELELIGKLDTQPK